MTTVLLIIHLLVATGLVAVVLMQRSEGGALGIGGGGPGGMMSGRGAATLLTRVTMILGAVFIANSILLAVVSGVDSSGRSVFDEGRGAEGLTTDDLFGDAFTEGELPEEGAEPEVPGDAPDGETASEAPAEDAPQIPDEEAQPGR